MSPAVTASAPGKALLSGEYAVLVGAPAISMALDRRAEVRIVRHRAGTHRLESSGYVNGCWRFRPAPNGGLEWLDETPSPDAFRLIECLWQRAKIDPASPLSIAVDTKAFFGDGGKLGIGSSAALAVAGAAALAAISDGQRPVYDLAADAHRAFQRGQGSGVDVATAYHGGVIEFRRDAASTALEWPRGLNYRLLSSGRSVRTTDKLAALAARVSPESDARLEAEAAKVASAWRTGRRGPLLEAFGAYVDALERFDVDRELGIFEAGHRALTALARARAGLIYKPCGAGGGDVGVALAESMQALDAFTGEAASYGFVAMDAALDPHGVLVEG